jgi:hypothetical protein
VSLQFDGVTGAVFEDNYFDLAPGRRRVLAFPNRAGGAQLSVRAVNADPVTISWNP